MDLTKLTKVELLTLKQAIQTELFKRKNISQTLNTSEISTFLFLIFNGSYTIQDAFVFRDKDQEVQKRIFLPFFELCHEKFGTILGKTNAQIIPVTYYFSEKVSRINAKFLQLICAKQGHYHIDLDKLHEYSNILCKFIEPKAILINTILPDLFVQYMKGLGLMHFYKFHTSSQFIEMNNIFSQLGLKLNLEKYHNQTPLTQN